MSDREISLLRNDIITLEGAIDRWKQSWNSLHRDKKQLEQELQKTRARLEKAESILKVSVDINISGWQTYRMANQYFKDKDKQGE